MKSILVFILLLASIVYINCGERPTRTSTCSPTYQVFDPQPLSHYNNTHLNVHLIAHTHDDIGWLKTVDQYYYGSWSNITFAGVQYILDSVMGKLAMDPTKKFIYVEVGFFERWWNEQNAATQTIVKNMVKTGQLTFINGGWCMNDEAAVYYEDAIDQMTLGHQFLLNNFGAIPDIAWHIDPFGHAAAQAALYAQMGFKAFFFSRIDYQDKDLRLNNSAMEMIWQPNTSQGIENSIFTHDFYFHYSAPRGFCFDIRCQDDPIMDDPQLEMYNLNTKADTYVAWFREQSQYYRTTDLIHTLGDDFNYQAAAINFKNQDKLLNYINANTKYNVNITYSTPIEYINKINSMNANKTVYPYKYDDFFPYSDVPNGYWTGYYTSRTGIKGYVRKTSRLFHTIKKMASQALWHNISSYVYNNWTTVNNVLYTMEVAMATAQHHDAVTGTEQQHVVWDYESYLYNATANALKSFINPFLNEKTAKDLKLSGFTFSMCQTNISAVFCNVTYTSLTHNQGVLLSVYNPAPQGILPTRVKVDSGKLMVLDRNANIIKSDVICANSTDTTDCDLFFYGNYSGYNYTYYFIVPSLLSVTVNPSTLSTGTNYTVNSNQAFKFSNLTDFTLFYNTSSMEFNLKYNYYKSYNNTGSQPPCDQNSGAYIFRPSNDTKNGSIPYATVKSAQVWKGNNLIQIQLVWDKIITNIRIYNAFDNGIEIESFVNSINIKDGIGKEIVLVIQSPNINNNGTFWTDSMGMEYQKRIRNFRPTWNLDLTQPVASNYYPINSAIFIQDYKNGRGFGLANDRSQGGGSIFDGEIEIMLHRRLDYDDDRGVEEPLDETDWDGEGLRQWMTHKLFVMDSGNLYTDPRAIQYADDQPIQIFMAPTSYKPVIETGTFFEESDSFSDSDSDEESIEEGAGLGALFNSTIKFWGRAIDPKTFIFRFQNMDGTNNRNVSTQIFNSGYTTSKNVTEMSLTYNQPKAQMITNRVNWNGVIYNNKTFINTDYLTNTSFVLRPLEIRTFKVILP